MECLWCPCIASEIPTPCTRPECQELWRLSLGEWVCEYEDSPNVPLPRILGPFQVPSHVRMLGTHVLMFRLLKASLIVTWGRWGLPIPYRIPLLYAVGKPLHLLHVENPTPHQIEAAHSEFCRALSDLFDRYKFYYGWGHKTLRIV